MSRSLRAPARLLLLAGLLLPASAGATPLRYDFFSGTATARLLQGTTLVASAAADLAGTFSTFDDAVPELVDFEFVVDDDTVSMGFLGNIDVFLTVTPSAGFSAPAAAAGVDRWSWEGGPVDVVGSLSFTGGALNGQTVPVNLTLADVRGFFRTDELGDDTFGFTDAIDVLDVTILGQPYKLGVNLAFKGVPVPEPATAALLAGGLAALAARRRAA
jgi:hypothetical protein